MAACRRQLLLRGVSGLTYKSHQQARQYATKSLTPLQGAHPLQEASSRLPPLSVMPLPLLLRSYILTSVLATPQILRICLPLMTRMANSKSVLLNPDRNVILHSLLRRIVFDHFTAGETETEVRKTIDDLKSLGFKGVILGYAKEVNVSGGETTFDASDKAAADFDTACVEAWKDGTLKTLSLLGKEDFLAVKFSGASKATLEALSRGADPPREMWEAMEAVCEAAAKQDSRLWIDAEQQNLQPTIDEWTTRLMRKYNRGEKALVYCTMQVYLKHMGENIGRHLRMAQEEGDWILAIKLVRGAYIATERRDLIHDTIEDTHAAYNKIVGDMLNQEYPGLDPGRPYPRTELFLATHNEESIQRGWAIQKARIEEGKPVVELGFGQLQGMADEVGCSLVQLCHDSKSEDTNSQQETGRARTSIKPDVFKCLTWGSTQECLQFLLRRVQENAHAFERTKAWAIGFRAEILRRLKGSLGIRA